jgi:hypothetical protein
VNGTDLKEITFYEYQETVKHIVVTQMHLVVVDESGLLNWLYKYIPVNIDDQTRLPFKLAQQYLAIADENPEKCITHVTYNQSFTRLIVGLADASLIILPIMAEPSQDEEDEPDPAKDGANEDVDEGAVKIHEVEATKLGPFQRGAVTMLKEFHNHNVMVSCCTSGNIAFWDIVKRDVLTSFTALG